MKTLAVLPALLVLAVSPPLMADELPQCGACTDTQIFQDVLSTDDQTRTWDNLADPRRKISCDDPAVLFTAPSDGSYRILVQDLCGSAQGDPRLFYLLTVRPPQPGNNRPQLAARPRTCGGTRR